ncbi:hypothetical protein DPMN_083850 [Dreissena polymorpha]|uniref:Uncharacterized protein n=1 Tax=Dreissena polymorpha TaxID=45954 RepID=A0A9D4BI31_DREPO|nr:hypothetical protein DPMN_083850 [Dreissena polymorpha]
MPLYSPRSSKTEPPCHSTHPGHPNQSHLATLLTQAIQSSRAALPLYSPRPPKAAGPPCNSTYPGHL